jgi:mono/diheme cytochrome c family protein
MDGRGDGPKSLSLSKKPRNLTDKKIMRGKSPESLFKVIADGKTPMPAWKSFLTEKQRWDVLFYAWSFSTTPQKIAAGKVIYDKYCRRCHGLKGDGKGSSAKKLRKKPQDFTDKKTMFVRSRNDLFNQIKKGSKPMPAFDNQLTDEEIWSVVDYLWTFTYQPLP